MKDSIPCLSTCTPKEISQYLLDHRFKGVATEAATFLLQAIDNLPNIEEINEALTSDATTTQQEAQNDDDSDNDENDEESSESTLGSPLKSIPQTTISAITPRSKFTIEMFQKGCTLTNNKLEQISIPSHTVKHVIMFPKREDCMKQPKRSKTKKHKNGDNDNDNNNTIPLPGSMVLIILEEKKVSYRQKNLSQICFQLPQHPSDPLHLPSTSTNYEHNELTSSELRDLIVDTYENQWSDILKSSLGVNHVVRVYNPKLHQDVPTAFQFQSDQGDNNTRLVQGGMPFVKCYSGVNDGVLYPLEEGILFFKPPHFIHRSQLHSISCGRGAGASSRFVDLAITLDDTSDAGDGENNNHESLEFTNIDREELQCLNNYIHNVLIKAMAKDAADDDDKDNNNNDDSDDVVVVKDDDESGATTDADDYVVIEESSRKRKKTKRSASVHARKATKVQLQSPASDDESDDEEDDDFIGVDETYEEDDDDRESFDEEEVDMDYELQEVDDGTDTESDLEE